MKVTHSEFVGLKISVCMEGSYRGGDLAWRSHCFHVGKRIEGVAVFSRDTTMAVAPGITSVQELLLSPSTQLFVSFADVS